MARTANRPTRRLALERRRTEAAARQKAYDALGSTPEAIIQSVRDEPHHYNMPREIARIHTKRIVAAAKEAK
jgi:hypothetical protein